ncbi:hypothetical protein DTL70_19885 [Streptomyces diacarni]|uniref:Barstar (barnase inhibitor) domain-containing protein n=1 Tax=Streptomyces diacarni TaxID=2800381 RepID=A0A367ES20_9ACTN|nr:hypothetical protein DTL70_19885 [Streptomyces diacarni]
MPSDSTETGIDLYALRTTEGFFGNESELATFHAPKAERLASPAHPPAPETLELRVLNSTGQPIAAYTIGSAKIVEEFRHGEGRVDLRVTGYLWDLPRARTEEIWSIWREDTTGHEPRVWARLDEEGRTAWLDAARLRAAWHYPLPATGSDEFIVEGAHVTDTAALYCALGEAMNGPGGYYGADLDALKDCLRGNFGPVAPFTLIWHNSRSGSDDALDLNQVGTPALRTRPTPWRRWDGC